MRKIACMLSLVLILTLVPGPVSYGLSEDDFMTLLEEIADIDDADLKEKAIGIIEDYVIDRDPPDVDKLKYAVKFMVPTAYEKKIEDKGYDYDEVIESLDIFGEMEASDVEAVVEIMKQSEPGENIDEVVADMEAIMEKYDLGEEEETSSGGSGGRWTGEPETTVLEDTTTGATIKMPAEIIKEVNFNDTANHWAAEEIKFLSERGVINGKGADAFEPQGMITRAEFNTLIVRLFGLEKKADESLDFEDIHQTDWFYDDVCIGKSYGLIKGSDDNRFDPYGQITREEMVTIIMRALKLTTYDIDTMLDQADPAEFDDQGAISEWAKENVEKGVSLGLIKGKGNDEFDPKGKATRGESAVLIKRLYDFVDAEQKNNLLRSGQGER